SFPLDKYWAHFADLQWYLQRISSGRLVVLSVSKHGCVGLRQAAITLDAMGSYFAKYLTIYAHWIWVFIKDGRTISETATLNGFTDNHLHVTLALLEDLVPHSMESHSVLERARWHYCESVGSMGDLCDEHALAILPIPSPTPLPTSARNVLKDIPVIVTAGKRPQYLYQTLKSLLSAPGVHPENILVVLGESTPATIQLLCLLNVKFTFLKVEGEQNKKLFIYYRRVFEYVGKNFPLAPASIFLDEDVEVSPDFFSFMSRTMWLLHADPTLYCINGFSATGFRGFSHDPSTVLRGRVQVEWGYAVTLKFIQEALRIWPLDTALADTHFYDEWLYKHASNNRECIFPEVSRTHHFGIGMNTDAYSAEAYFLFMPTVTAYNVPLDNINTLLYWQYQTHFQNSIKNAIVLEGNPCKEGFIPSVTHSTTFVFYYSMDRDAHGKRVYLNYFYTAKCLGVWAQSEQGQHDLVMTVRVSKWTTLHLVGAPYSPHGHLCPPRVKPWHVDSLSDEDYDIMMNRIRYQELGNYIVPNRRQRGSFSHEEKYHKNSETKATPSPTSKLPPIQESERTTTTHNAARIPLSLYRSCNYSSSLSILALGVPRVFVCVYLCLLKRVIYTL
ncbi:hypothetical protein SK128_014285, partial [Halocaridina rubra]